MKLNRVWLVLGITVTALVTSALARADEFPVTMIPVTIVVKRPRPKVVPEGATHVRCERARALVQGAGTVIACTWVTTK